ncbi:MAG: hypothetical protein KY453_05360 [Gemmatimonadetes bacterium]|nr:hypothetical protein [Gemmatimonadota bacterium]
MSALAKTTGWAATAATLALVLAWAPAPAAGQSLLATGGLGAPVDAVDARARALGGAAVGLRGGHVSAVDPAAAVDLRVPTVTFTSVTSWIDVREGDAEASVSGTRFPSIGLAYPAGGWGVATLTFGGMLDQRWRIERIGSVELGGRAVETTDRFLSEGGLGAARLGFAHRVAPSLGVGVSVGALTGEVTRSFTRAFDTLAAGDVPVSDFQASGRWDYSGVTASAGAVVDVSQLLRATASLTWNGTLDASPSGPTEGAGRSYELPLEVRAGASGVLAPGLSATVGVEWADWSDVGNDLVEPSNAGRALAMGGGVEWSDARLLGKDAAIRLGYRRADLPFAFGAADADESAWTGGLGLVLASGGGVTLASVDLSLERGERLSGVLEESFWRAGLTLRVAGF